MPLICLCCLTYTNGFLPNHTSTLWSTGSHRPPERCLVVLLGGGSGLALALETDGTIGHEVAGDRVGGSSQSEANDDTYYSSTVVPEEGSFTQSGRGPTYRGG